MPVEQFRLDIRLENVYKCCSQYISLTVSLNSQYSYQETKKPPSPSLESLISQTLACFLVVKRYLYILHNFKVTFR